jgi:trimeric autotransporter adhesin
MPVIMTMRHGLLLSFVVLFGLVQLAAAGGAARPAESGSITVLDAASGRELAHLRANGAVIAAVSDGHGGWFIGGSFTRLGGQHRVALAHLLTSGTVDPAWQAAISSARERPVAVQALARAGSRLFIAGPFGRVGGLPRGGLAAVDTGSGHVLRSWTPKPPAWLDIGALLVAGQRLLVARQSTYPTPGITALDTVAGAVDHHWNSHLRLIGDAGSFNTLLLQGSRVYVAGSFHVSGLQRNGLLAVAAANGQADRRFAPQVPNCSVCNGFAVLYGLAASARRLYVSGDFKQIGGRPRDGVAALDPRTGAVDAHWQPARGGADVIRLALAGDALYLGGLSGLWALDARAGTLLPRPHVTAPRQVLALTTSGGRLLVAGRD